MKKVQVEKSFQMSIHGILTDTQTFLDSCKFSDDSIHPYDGCIGLNENERIQNMNNFRTKNH